ncbi:MAG: insulinase family protein [Magnetococcales bacterium]|nr:insulinase family protein [Magnetococcales bacterium]
MHDDPFECLERQRVEALNLTVESYRHRRTGARHLHLAAEDHHNAFLVAFLTVPANSSGVAHVLEHTALCGSERFPVRDPFFMMLRRSLCTFMNAFTSSDWTAYPFASQSRKDFDNLLEVYLDAAFFPRLDYLDFAQEGCRVEFTDPNDPGSGLVWRGVVYNEMKGAMSSPARVLWEELSRHLFPTTTYRFNSGGDPEEIPELRWEDLKAFHSRHYHPSNAVFLTYGSIRAAEHQAVFESRVLSRFQPLALDLAVPDERRLAAPVRETRPYAVDEGSATQAKSYITLSWLLGKSADLTTLLRAHLLTGILLDNSSSPLLRALETSELGSAPSPVIGLDDSSREMVFACGLEGSEPEHADQVEAMILAVLEKVAVEGVEPERVEAVLHQLEMSRREIGGDGMPYGLQLMLTALTPALHGGDPVSALAMDEVLVRLREDIQSPGFIQGLVRSWFLDNPHRVRLVLMPDPGLAVRKRQKESARLAAIAEGLSEADRQEILARSRALKRRQGEVDDPEILPRLRITDIPEHPPVAQGRLKEVAGLPTHWYNQPTNGLVYIQLLIDLPELDPELTDLLPVFASCLTEVGCGNRSYLETQAWQSLVSGGVIARGSVRSRVDDVGRFRGVFLVSGKALTRNHQHLSQLLTETFRSARFDELPRLRELIAQMRASSELRVTDNGHVLAMSTASSGMSPTAALNERWGGLTGLRSLKLLDQSMQNPEALTTFAARLERLRDILGRITPQILVVGEEESFENIREGLAAAWGDGGTSSPPAPFAFAAKIRRVHTGWVTPTQVHFVSKAYPVVPFTHEDAPSLTVLAQFLRNGFLHRAVREQGGAYGSGAGFDADAGAFRFYSYRDPRLAETLADFDRSLDWLFSTSHDERALEEAILGVIGALDRPGSPAGEAKRAFHDAYHGKSPEIRRRFRDGVLGVDVESMRRVAARHLVPARASVGIVSNAESLAGLADPELEIRHWQLPEETGNPSEGGR